MISRRGFLKGLLAIGAAAAIVEPVSAVAEQVNIAPDEYGVHYMGDGWYRIWFNFTPKDHGEKILLNANGVVTTCKIPMTCDPDKVYQFNTMTKEHDNGGVSYKWPQIVDVPPYIETSRTNHLTTIGRKHLAGPNR